MDMEKSCNIAEELTKSLRYTCNIELGDEVQDFEYEKFSVARDARAWMAKARVKACRAA